MPFERARSPHTLHTIRKTDFSGLLPIDNRRRQITVTDTHEELRMYVFRTFKELRFPCNGLIAEIVVPVLQDELKRMSAETATNY